MLILALLAPSAFAQDIGACDNFEAVDAPEVTVDEACQSEPRVGSFNPVVEWRWTASANYAGYEHIMTPPMVANLTDDNGDGLINADDVPDIAVVAHSYYGWSNYGVLMVLSGDGTGEHLSLNSIGGYGFIGGAGVAIGDLEGDGSPDICVGGYDAGVICAEADGTYKWHGGTRVTYGAAHPVIGDMDGDGCAEVAVGAQVFDCAGTLLFSGASGDSDVGIGAVTAMADMDLDGQLELVAGNAVYERDGSTLWVDGGAEGYPAVADLDADGLPEIVRTGNGTLTATDDDGSILWSVALPGGGRGGPPTVADFDGDDAPEIGVAGSVYYTVFEADGSVLWYSAVSDTTSNITGSAVFDFEGDGRAEVVYADEYTLYVFDGSTGGILLAESGHDSATWFEYPVIADVDGDGSSEILLGSNRYRSSSEWVGLTVIGDADSSWVGSRPIWNQHSYHITNINDDGSVPTAEQRNWESWNNFRSAGLLSGPSDWYADVEVLGAQWCHSDCNDDPRVVEVWLELGNSGPLDAEAVTLEFYRYEANLPQAVLEDSFDLAAGESGLFGPFTFAAEDWGEGDLWVSLDPGGALLDCDEGNQDYNLGWWPYPVIDADGDGHDPLECGGDDCDDSDPFVGPDASEQPYNGVDDDCDEASLDDDLDGDGFDAASDCDDADPGRNPDAEDLPDNGVDEDCDGLDAVGDEGGDDTGVAGDPKDDGDCGCAHGRPGAGWSFLALLALAARRRTRIS